MNRLRPGPDFAPAVVPQLLAHHAARRGDKRFLVCGASQWTYREMDAVADRVAAGFHALGVGRGDRVAILTPNRGELFELLFGLARLGAVQVPLNVFLRGEFLRYQLADCGAEVIVVDGDGAHAVAPLLDALADVRTVVALDPGSLPDAVAFADVRACTDPPPPVTLSPADLMTILYTSGTTGFPKGCMLPHGYDVRVGELMATSMQVTEDDVLFTALPGFHAVTRMMVTTAALTRGAGVAVEESFSASGFLPRAAQVGATVGFGVGMTGVALLATPRSDADRAHRIRTMMIGPFTPDQQHEFAERFGIDAWAEIFGQTECVGITWSPVAGPRRPDTVGTASPDLEVAVLDDAGEPVVDGEVGELCLRPRHRLATFAGYWGKPEATVEAFAGLWYHSGDFVRRDGDGYFVFVDRKKDAIRRRGENISSFELETAIARHPDIADVAVHGVPSGSAEDEVMAVVVAAADATLDPAELFAFFAAELPYFAVPRYVRVLAEIPRNAVMRVQKFRLRELALDDAVWDFAALGLVLTESERRASSPPLTGKDAP